MYTLCIVMYVVYYMYNNASHWYLHNLWIGPLLFRRNCVCVSCFLYKVNNPVLPGNQAAMVIAQNVAQNGYCFIQLG